MSITGFEQYSPILNEYQKDKVVPRIIRGLITAYESGREKYEVPASAMVTLLKNEGFSGISGPVIRKVIHHISCRYDFKEGVVLIANSKGYKITNNTREIDKWITSMEDRAGAMWHRVRCIKDISMKSRQQKLKI